MNPTAAGPSAGPASAPACASLERRGRSALRRPALWPRLLLAGGVHAYRYTLKPWLGNDCRFEPSCSAYALSALEQHGALRGSALSAWRLVRCNPWCKGGHDPVPPARPPGAAPANSVPPGDPS